MEQRTKIGYLVGGGLKENFRVRLIVSPQEIQEGAFVVIQSGEWNYYGIVTDIVLGATDPRFADEQMEGRFPSHISKALHGQTLYANLEVLPNLMLEIGPQLGTAEYKDWRGRIDAGLKDEPRILPVKNVPPHHAQVFLANAGDIAEIFGSPDEKENLVIGYTREQNHPVCIDMEKFVQRSSGVFGATGTGKSTVMDSFLPKIRERGDRCFVIDLDGSFYARHGLPGDLILNPYDARSVQWSPFAELVSDEDYRRIAEAMIPPAQDDFGASIADDGLGHVGAVHRAQLRQNLHRQHDAAAVLA